MPIQRRPLLNTDSQKMSAPKKGDLLRIASEVRRCAVEFALSSQLARHI